MDVEKVLLKENRKLASPKDLERLKIFHEQKNMMNDEVLERCGLNKNILRGYNIYERLEENWESIKSFNQERVFHISQIKSICKKYHLKFFNVEYFEGKIPDNFNQVLSDFENKYGVELYGYMLYVMAPAPQFNLTKKPKDPILFYQINNEYFYLIYKWGEDLSIFRRFLPMLSQRCTLTFLFLSLFIIFLGGAILSANVITVAGCVISLILTVIFSIYNYAFENSDYEYLTIVRPNFDNWYYSAMHTEYGFGDSIFRLRYIFKNV